MAAIAKFITYEGGIAFSDSVMKIQKRGAEGTVIPLDDVSSVSVFRPREDADGFIRVLTTDGRRFRLGFGDEQYRQAAQFKQQFDALFFDGGDSLAAARLSGGRPVRQAAAAPAPSRDRYPVRERTPRERVPVQPEPEYGDDAATRVLTVLVVVAALIVIALGVLLILPRLNSLRDTASAVFGAAPLRWRIGPRI